MRRRDFITIIGGGAAMWPLTAKGQQKLRRIGVLFVLSASDPENQARLAVFVQSLRDLGWIEGHNVQFEVLAPFDPLVPQWALLNFAVASFESDPF